MQSQIIQSAVDAMLSAKETAAKQGTLHELRKHQGVLFDDVLSTLRTISVAADVLATSEDIGKQFLVSASHLSEWIAKHPDGVAWPITVAATVAADKIAMPFRILIMMPVHGKSAHLEVARGLLRLLADRSSNIAPEAKGRQSAAFLGLQCDDSGVWEYAAAAGILFNRGSEVDTITLTMVPSFVELRAKIERCSPAEAAGKFLIESVFDELGLVIGAAASKPTGGE